MWSYGIFLIRRGLAIAGMAFLEMVNKRLDHVQAYNSKSYSQTCVSAARGWVKRWGKLRCSQITREMVEQFALARKKVSAYTANKEMTYLKATLNFGLKKGLVTHNPVRGIAFFPEEKRLLKLAPIKDKWNTFGNLSVPSVPPPLRFSGDLNFLFETEFVKG